MKFKFVLTLVQGRKLAQGGAKMKKIVFFISIFMGLLLGGTLSVSAISVYMVDESGQSVGLKLYPDEWMLRNVREKVAEYTGVFPENVIFYSGEVVEKDEKTVEKVNQELKMTQGGDGITGRELLEKFGAENIGARITNVEPIKASSLSATGQNNLETYEATALLPHSKTPIKVELELDSDANVADAASALRTAITQRYKFRREVSLKVFQDSNEIPRERQVRLKLESSQRLMFQVFTSEILTKSASPIPVRQLPTSLHAIEVETSYVCPDEDGSICVNLSRHPVKGFFTTILVPRDSTAKYILDIIREEKGLNYGEPIFLFNNYLRSHCSEVYRPEQPIPDSVTKLVVGAYDPQRCTICIPKKIRTKVKVYHVS